MSKRDWHSKNITEVFASVGSEAKGLSSAEAENRLKIYGTNELPTYGRTSSIMRFLRQFHNILIYVLLVSAIVTIYFGYLVDAGVILAVVILNAFFGFIQEGKAQKAIEAIRHLLAPNANVIRDGEHIIVLASTLVVGDVVLLKSGDKVPADLRLFYTKNLQIQEAILTGESNAIEKNIEPVEKNAPLGDRINMAYSGTSVAYGRGTGVVVAAGINTEMGKIGRMLTKITPLTTPLLKEMNTFGRWLTLAIIILTIITFLIGILLWEDPVEQMFMSAIGLAVAAIPEGLPPILTIILAIGVTRMAKRNAIIRQLPAVETMGAITTICSDKTGTLTRNEQTVGNIITAKHSFNVEENNGIVFSTEKGMTSLKEHEDLLLAVNAAILCNDAEFTKDARGKWHIHGNPIDKSLLELGSKAKIDLHFLQEKFPRSDLIPYESEHKFMATLHHSHDDGGFIYIKGAPEQILAKCNGEIYDGKRKPINYDHWQKQTEILAHHGYRVLAIATREAPADKYSLLFDDVEKDLSLVAVFGLIDAPRIEAAQAIEQCYNAGIKVKMITGDHAVTAATIASQVGLDNKFGVLTGANIDEMSDLELAKAVADINIYARTSPHHKLRLVQALQANGELVAMTGDGVNDAPALRKANIGIAMGHKGAEIAKESSAMVLADDNFATIVYAIEEGRVVYDNLKKAILLILPTNGAEALTIVIAVIFGFVLPITPVQILWVNMLTAVTLAITLGFEPAENNVMDRPPRKTKASILSKFIVWRIVFVGTLLVASVEGLFMWLRMNGTDLAIARTVAVNMLVTGEALYLLNCRKLHGSVLSFKAIVGNKLIVIAIAITMFFQLLFTYLPIMQHFFGTTAISISQWSYIVSLSIFVFIIVEIEKLFTRRFILKQKIKIGD